LLQLFLVKDILSEGNKGVLHMFWEWGIWNNFWQVIGSALGAGIGGWIAYKIAISQTKSERRAAVEAIIIQKKLETLLDLIGGISAISKKYEDARFLATNELERHDVNNIKEIHRLFYECLLETEQLTDKITFIDIEAITDQFKKLLTIDGSEFLILKQIEKYVNENKTYDDSELVGRTLEFAHERAEISEDLRQAAHSTKNELYT